MKQKKGIFQGRSWSMRAVHDFHLSADWYCPVDMHALRYWDTGCHAMSCTRSLLENTNRCSRIRVQARSIAALVNTFFSLDLQWFRSFMVLFTWCDRSPPSQAAGSKTGFGQSFRWSPSSFPELRARWYISPLRCMWLFSCALRLILTFHVIRCAIFARWLGSHFVQPVAAFTFVLRLVPSMWSMCTAILSSCRGCYVSGFSIKK